MAFILDRVLQIRFPKHISIQYFFSSLHLFDDKLHPVFSLIFQKKKTRITSSMINLKSCKGISKKTSTFPYFKVCNMLPGTTTRNYNYDHFVGPAVDTQRPTDRTSTTSSNCNRSPSTSNCGFTSVTHNFQYYFLFLPPLRHHLHHHYSVVVVVFVIALSKLLWFHSFYCSLRL